MGKIFGYECRRLLWNKFFVGLLLVLLFYGWQVLTGATLLGVAHTAPFSPWSFGDYLGQMTPLLWIGALFFLTFFTSGKARRAAVLTDATQADPRRYALARSAAALAGTALLALACLGEAAVFYGACFDWYGWGGSWPSPPWPLWSPRWSSPWGAAGCWDRSGPGWSTPGCPFPPGQGPSPAGRPWASGTGASLRSIP